MGNLLLIGVACALLTRLVKNEDNASIAANVTANVHAVANDSVNLANSCCMVISFVGFILIQIVQLVPTMRARMRERERLAMVAQSRGHVLKEGTPWKLIDIAAYLKQILLENQEVWRDVVRQSRSLFRAKMNSSEEAEMLSEAANYGVVRVPTVRRAVP